MHGWMDGWSPLYILVQLPGSAIAISITFLRKSEPKVVILTRQLPRGPWISHRTRGLPTTKLRIAISPSPFKALVTLPSRSRKRLYREIPSSRAAALLLLLLLAQKPFHRGVSFLVAAVGAEGGS